MGMVQRLVEQNTAVVRRPILKVLTMGRTVCFVAAAGATMRGAVVLLSAAATALAIAAAALGSACPYKFATVVRHSSDVHDASSGGVKNSKF